MNRERPFAEVCAIRLPEDFIRRVREMNDIVVVIGEHLRLTRAGKDFKGLCPFHTDHHPSLTVSPSKQIYKCFSCGAAGGVIAFVQQYHKLDFLPAVEMLAQRVGLPIPKDSTESAGEQAGPGTGDLVKVNTWAAEFFAKTLRDRPAAEQARQYLKKRGLSPQTVSDFMIGYSLPDWDGLIQSARTAGFQLDWLLKAGLVKSRTNGEGAYDVFRDRLMFPIHDGMGRIIAFGGRTLGDDQPKYLNTAATPLFDKGRCLFGLAPAREAIGHSDEVIVVEGYTDVCMAHQHGFKNAVATLGTALSSEHVRLLKRFAAKIIMVYDGDDAGIKAMDRALDVALPAGGNLNVAILPDGMDPCDLLVAKGREPFEKALSASAPALDYHWKSVAAQLGSSASYDDRLAAGEQFIQRVAKASQSGLLDPIHRGFWANHLYQVTGLKVEDIQRALQRMAKTVTVGKPVTPDVRHAAYKDLLGAALVEPPLLTQASGLVDLSEIADFRVFFYLKFMLDKADLGEPCQLSDLLDLVPHPPTYRWLIELTEEVEQIGDVPGRMERAIQALLTFREQQRLNTALQDVRVDKLSNPAGSADKLRELHALAKKPDMRRVGPAVG